MNEQFISLLGLALGVILVNNLVFSQLLGMGPFLSASGSTRGAVTMGLSVTLVTALSSAVCWPLNAYVLEPNGLKYIEVILFILTTVFLVKVVELALQKLAPAFRAGLGDTLPLTANCGVLGVILQNVQNGSGFLQSVTYGLAGGLSFLLAIVLFSSIRERLEFADCPKAFEGIPIALAAAGLLALCFTGFSNLNVFG